MPWVLWVKTADVYPTPLYLPLSVLQTLNYGQSVFEGMKAQRSAEGNVVLFR